MLFVELFRLAELADQHVHYILPFQAGGVVKPGVKFLGVHGHPLAAQVPQLHADFPAARVIGHVVVMIPWEPSQFPADLKADCFLFDVIHGC